MTINDAMMSSDRHDWQTPDNVLELVRKVGSIALDPCSSADNPTDATFAWTHSGLGQDWGDYGACEAGDSFLVYVNPPYGRSLPAWIEKCAVEGERGCQIVLLTPARPDTGWYDSAIESAHALCEWRGRIRFKGAPSCAPFPSALFYWGPNPFLFCHVFQGVGRVRVMRQLRRE